MDVKELRRLKRFSAQLRIDQLEMFRQRGMGHIGGCLSVTELISVLYGKQMKFDPKNPHWEGRDYLVMSKPRGSSPYSRNRCNLRLIGARR